MAVGNPVIDLYSVVVQIDGTTIAGVSDDGLPFPSGSSKVRDVSTQDSGIYTEKKLGRFDAGNTNLKGNYIAGDAGQQALQAAATDRAVHTFTIDISAQGGGIITFDALVTKYQPGNSSNTETFSATLEVTGEPTTATTYPDLSGLTVATGVLIPSFGATIDDYVATVATGVGTLTVTPTAAAGVSMWVDGTEITGTTTNKSVTLGAAGSVTESKIKVSQTGKATRFIKIYIGRP